MFNFRSAATFFSGLFWLVFFGATMFFLQTVSDWINSGHRFKSWKTISLHWICSDKWCTIVQRFNAMRSTQRVLSKTTTDGVLQYASSSCGKTCSNQLDWWANPSEMNWWKCFSVEPRNCALFSNNISIIYVYFALQLKLWYDFWFEITSANIPNTKRLTFDCPPFDQEFSNVGTMGLHFGIWGLFQPYFDDVVVFQNKSGISNSRGGGSKGGVV